MTRAFLEQTKMLRQILIRLIQVGVKLEQVGQLHQKKQKKE